MSYIRYVLKISNVMTRRVRNDFLAQQQSRFVSLPFVLLQRLQLHDSYNNIHSTSCHFAHCKLLMLSKSGEQGWHLDFAALDANTAH